MAFMGQDQPTGTLATEKGRSEMPFGQTEEGLQPVVQMSQEEITRLSIAQRVWSDYQSAKQGKTQIDEEWIEALLAHAGKYSDTVMQELEEKGMSKAFVNLTRSEVSKAVRYLIKVIGGANYPFSLKPTPVPEIEGMDPKMMNEAISAALDEAQVPPEMRAQIEEQFDFKAMLDNQTQEAYNRANRMQREIKDQFVECNFFRGLLQNLESWCVIGTMIIKGPFPEYKNQRQWVKPAKDGKWVLDLKRVNPMKFNGPGDLGSIRPAASFIDPHKFYPDPTGSKVEDMGFVVVEHDYTRHGMRTLLKDPTFFRRDIETLLSQGGNYQLDGVAARVRAIADMVQTDLDASKYQVLEWHGWIDGKSLADMGEDIPESLYNSELLAEFWTCGNTLIKASVSNAIPPRIPFYIIPYERVSNRWAGRGIPKQMGSSQKTYNAYERGKIDGMAFSVGPQVAVTQGSLINGTDGKVRPLQCWELEEGRNVQESIMFFQPVSSIPHLNEAQRLTRTNIERETSLPDLIAGIGSPDDHKRTVEGLSMQQANALTYIYGVVGNMDEEGIKPLVTAFYDWNMAWNPNDEIKGDYQVEAGGVLGALSSEVESGRIMQALQLIGEDVKDWLKPQVLVQRFYHSMGYDDIGAVRTEDEVKQLRAERAQSEAEIRSAPKRVQPVMPPLNAAIEILQNTPATSPMYGAAYENAVRLSGGLTGSMAAGINAFNQAALATFKAVISPQDQAAIAADVTPDPNNALQGAGGAPVPAPGSEAGIDPASAQAMLQAQAAQPVQPQVEGGAQ